MKIRRIFLILLFSFLFFSCEDENPDLVNPPDKTSSIRYRFVNLALDKQSREIKVGESSLSPSTAWGNISPTFNPPADTGYISIYKNGSIEFELSNLTRFIRNTNYTYFALSSHICDNLAQCGADTIIGLRTTNAIPDNNFESLLKFINAYPDTTLRISIREGCPNGNILFTPHNYKQYSINPITVRSGDLNFSVVISSTNLNGIRDSAINLYSSNLVAKGQYTIVAHQDINGGIAITILDENDLTTNALSPAKIIPEKTTEMRTINISDSEILVKIRNSDTINSNISKQYIDNYNTISACISSFNDTLDIVTNNSINSSISASLDVLSKYSLLVFNKDKYGTLGSVLLEPQKLNVETKGKAIIRVINTINEEYRINVSVGARKETDKTKFPSNFSSGISLSNQLQFHTVSSFSVVNPGPAPLSVFTSSYPSRLLYAANTYFEADKEYIIVVSKDKSDEIKLTMISNDEENKKINYLEKGVFLQIVNSSSDNSSIKIDINSKNTGRAILENAELHITNSLATVLDSTNQEIFINGQIFTSNAQKNERIMLVAGGKSNDLRVIINKFEPLNENNRFRVRFVNSTYDIPLLYLKKNLQDSTFFETVEINNFSSYTVENREQKPSFFFYEPGNTGYVGRFSDVIMSLGKSYCIIMYGYSSRECLKYSDKNSDVEPNCYSFIIQQEF